MCRLPLWACIVATVTFLKTSSCRGEALDENCLVTHLFNTVTGLAESLEDTKEEVRGLHGQLLSERRERELLQVKVDRLEAEKNATTERQEQVNSRLWNKVGELQTALNETLKRQASVNATALKKLVGQHDTTLAELLDATNSIDNSVRELKDDVTSLLEWFPTGVTVRGDGSSEFSAGVTCYSIRKYQLTWQGVLSSVRWINPRQVDGEAFQIYCDFESYGGGWSLIYSSRDDNTGHNNMQRGDRGSAHITSLDPGNANKRIAYDVFKSIANSTEGYSEVMLTGYRDYQDQSHLIKMYFSKTPNTGLDFTQLIDRGLAGTIPFTPSGTPCDIAAMYNGTEISSGKPIALNWEDNAFVAGSVSPLRCAWHKEVWNEIDNVGGHLLAPQDWANAEDEIFQTSLAGACRQRGLFHIFIR